MNTRYAPNHFLNSTDATEPHRPIFLYKIVVHTYYTGSLTKHAQDTTWDTCERSVTHISEDNTVLTVFDGPTCKAN